jgi:hypothetical protein
MALFYLFLVTEELQRSTRTGITINFSSPLLQSSKKGKFINSNPKENDLKKGRKKLQ